MEQLFKLTFSIVRFSITIKFLEMDNNFYKFFSGPNVGFEFGIDMSVSSRWAYKRQKYCRRIGLLCSVLWRQTCFALKDDLCI